MLRGQLMGAVAAFELGNVAAHHADTYNAEPIHVWSDPSAAGPLPFRRSQPHTPSASAVTQLRLATTTARSPSSTA